MTPTEGGAGSVMVPVKLRASNVTVRRGTRAILRDVNLEFLTGQVTAIIGANGAGKSTLLAALAGLRRLEHDDGAIQLEGRDLASLSKNALALKLAFLPAHSSVPFPISVSELIQLAEPHQAAYIAALEAMELEALEHTPVTRLSTGEAKRAWLAMMLSRQTPVLLLDEPLAGLDPRYQVRLLETLQARASAGACVIFIAHDIPYAARANRVIALGGARVVADGSPGDVLRADLLRELYGVEVWLGLEPSTGAVVPLPTRAV
jgi:iron complex transport system ATP-binding protein